MTRAFLATLFTLAFPLGQALVRRLPGFAGDVLQALLILPVLPGYLLYFFSYWSMGWARPDSLAIGNWSASNLAVMGLLNLGLYACLFAAWGLRRPPESPAAGGISRREVLGRALLVGTATAGAWSTLVEPSWVDWTSHRVALPGLPSRLHGLRVALVSDIHRGGYNTMDYLVRVADELNRWRPDLVLMPGDFVFGSAMHFGEAAEFVARLRTRVAPLGTLGNHDHWQGAREARRQLGAAGMHLLDNGRAFLDERGELTPDAPRRGLCLAGVGDLWAGSPDLRQALDGIPEGMPRLLLSHNPDFAEEPEAQEFRGRVDLMLSGHTHGGQVRLPVAGAPLLPSRYGQKYAEGWCRGPRWPVYVSRGVGTTLLPVRFGVRPEVALFELGPGARG